jgi:hypothetical protein
MTAHSEGLVVREAMRVEDLIQRSAPRVSKDEATVR